MATPQTCPAILVRLMLAMIIAATTTIALDPLGRDPADYGVVNTLSGFSAEGMCHNGTHLYLVTNRIKSVTQEMNSSEVKNVIGIGPGGYQVTIGMVEGVQHLVMQKYGQLVSAPINVQPEDADFVSLQLRIGKGSGGTSGHYCGGISGAGYYVQLGLSNEGAVLWRSVDSLFYLSAFDCSVIAAVTPGTGTSTASTWTAAAVAGVYYTKGHTDNAVATVANLWNPAGMAWTNSLTQTGIYFIDKSIYIKEYTIGGGVTTIVGDGSSAFTVGPGTSASIQPKDLAVVGGWLFFLDNTNKAIGAVDITVSSHDVYSIIGGQPGSFLGAGDVDGDATVAKLTNPKYMITHPWNLDTALFSDGGVLPNLRTVKLVFTRTPTDTHSETVTITPPETATKTATITKVYRTPTSTPMVVPSVTSSGSGSSSAGVSSVPSVVPSSSSTGPTQPPATSTPDDSSAFEAGATRSALSAVLVVVTALILSLW